MGQNPPAGAQLFFWASETPESLWTLEVVDREVGPKVWEHPFPTDRAALDEIMERIKMDGIGGLQRNGDVKLQ